MKQKSLRQLGKELGVSHSYLSQVKSGKQSTSQYAKILSCLRHGGVSELADEHDLGSCAERHRGSSPRFPTRNG